MEKLKESWRDKLIRWMGGPDVIAAEIGLEGTHQLYQLLGLGGLYSSGGRIGFANGKKAEGIMNLAEAKKVGLSDRDLMQEQLKSLYSHEFLDGLNNDQIFDLFEEMIHLPGLQHISYKKPPRPTLNGNVRPSWRSRFPYEEEI